MEGESKGRERGGEERETLGKRFFRILRPPICTHVIFTHTVGCSIGIWPHLHTCGPKLLIKANPSHCALRFV